MLVGIGADVVDVGRIEKALTRWGERFIERVYTPAERASCRRKANALLYWAGRFAAKEAVLKALGVGLNGAGFKEVEVLHDAGGRPVVVLKGRAAVAARVLNVSRVLLTISHDTGTAVAFAVAERED